MSAFDDSGQDPPGLAANFIEADVTLDSGQDPPGAEALTRSSAGVAPAPHPGTPQAVTVRITIQKPHPFSVSITSDTGIQIVAVDIDVLENKKSVFHADVGTAATTALGAGQTRVIPLTNDQLQKLQPHLKVGNVVQAKVQYFALQRAQLKIAIVAQNTKER